MASWGARLSTIRASGRSSGPTSGRHSGGAALQVLGALPLGSRQPPLEYPTTSRFTPPTSWVYPCLPFPTQPPPGSSPGLRGRLRATRGPVIGFTG